MALIKYKKVFNLVQSISYAYRWGKHEKKKRITYLSVGKHDDSLSLNFLFIYLFDMLSLPLFSLLLFLQSNI